MTDKKHPDTDTEQIADTDLDDVQGGLSMIGPVSNTTLADPMTSTTPTLEPEGERFQVRINAGGPVYTDPDDMWATD